MQNQKVIVKDGMVGEGVDFERIRRITGYLVGDARRWNDGKKSELSDRVKHKINAGHKGLRLAGNDKIRN